MNTVDSSRSIRISIISIIVNVVLSALKFVVGIVGFSQALVADAVHSLSDVLSTVIVIAALFISGKPADKDHEYGHQRYESLASLLLAILLAYVGVRIGYNGVKLIISGEYRSIPAPTTLTAIAALVSIAAKEIMYRRTMAIAVRERSNALKADAFHHRSDALSSVGSLAGVLFARLGLPVMDSVAGIIICIFILKTAAEIFLDAVKALTDSAGDPDLEKEIRDKIEAVDGVERVDELKTRIFGSGYYADVEIAVDGSKTLKEAHRIAETVHGIIEADFTDIWHCTVHVNPKEEDR